ncbi:MAG: hypothetical protein IMW89_22405 [Ktedonobacteraceae bacterium]|nr:hypothetical protein [Ktedonobacteraceae bacterium]
MQLLAIILFYYVFLLGAVLLTWWTVRLAMQAYQESKKHKEESRKR